MKDLIKLTHIIALVLFVSSCDPIDPGNECETELHYGGHYLKIPVSITPHKSIYQIGDTITISTIFSDSIYDLSAMEAFKIEHFPFKPISLLYRYYEDLQWDAGFRVNNVIIDTLYKPLYKYSSKYADSYLAHTVYDKSKEEYEFIMNIVLQEKGIYFLLLTDLYQENLGTGNIEYNYEADAISFEGKCPGALYSISCMIDSGIDHQNLFEEELVHLDTSVYRGQLTSNIGNATSAVWPGSQAIEYLGFFAFEVEE